MTETPEWDKDDWPKLQKEVDACDILVLCTSVWLGEKSSVCNRVLERMYGYTHSFNDKGQYRDYGKVGATLITGNEDGVKHCAMNILFSLSHIGYTVPPQADAGWMGEAGPGPSYADEGSGGPRERLHQPQHDLPRLELHAPRPHAQGPGRHPGARQPARGLGRGVQDRLPEPRAQAVG
jgi:multimeric flavodoxin WrbA